MFRNRPGSELSLDAIQQAAVIPVILAFAEDRSLMSLALVGPQVGVACKPRRQHAGARNMRVHVSMSGWTGTRVDIQIGRRGSVPGMDFLRLGGSVLYHPRRLRRIGLDAGMVEPRRHTLSVAFQPNPVCIKLRLFGLAA